MTNVITDRLQESNVKFNLTFDNSIFVLLVVFLLCSAFSIALTQIGYFSALTIWVGKMIFTREFSWPRTPIDLFFLGYVAAEVIATVFAYNKAQSLLYLQRRLLLLPIVYVLVANIRSTKNLRISVSAIVLSALGVALWSFGDLFTHLGEYLRFQRRLAEFQIYMTGGGIMMIAILLLLPFAVHEKTPAKIRSLVLVSVIPLAANLLFTFTRSSWLGFIAGTVVIALKRNKKILIPLGVLVVAVILFSSPDMRDRIYSIVDPYHPTNITRVHMWETGMNMFLDHPIVGIGDIGTEQLWDWYAQPEWQPEGHLHNNLLMWLVTLGIVGFIALVALFVKIWMVIARIERSARGDWFTGSLALGGLAVLAGFHINGLFEWNFGDAEIIMLVWAVVGLVLAAEKVSQREDRI